MSKENQPVRRCIICGWPETQLKANSIPYTEVESAGFIKQTISMILEEHKDDLPAAVKYKLSQLRKLHYDALLCTICIKYLSSLVQRPAPRQKKFRLDVKDSAPQSHPDRLREGEPKPTAAEARTFRDLIRQLKSGDGPAMDKV